MNSKVISLAGDFSPSPAGRDLTDGPFTGAGFRDEILLPALRAYREVIVDLDGTAGMGSSFLEEAFGGLVRLGFSERDLKSRLKIKTARKSYEERIWQYINRAHELSHH